MERAGWWIVRRRNVILVVLLCVCAVCAALSFKVPINADMTKYLPDDSRMKQGMDIMTEEFGGMSMPASLRVMMEDLPEEAEAEVIERLKEFSAAASVSRTGQKSIEGKTYTLFTVSMNCEYRTQEALNLEYSIPGAFPEWKTTVVNDDKNGMDIPLFIYATALVVLLVVLFLFCSSWLEPIVFLFVIGMAILMNMGTNLILGSVSVTTHSISAILQLVLSMDYSIILMNRFRQESASEKNPEKAMVQALKGALRSIVGSGFTTIVGLLMLVFMRFKIGADIGLVLAKGVFLSMCCCLTTLPAAILVCRRGIIRTEKGVLRIPTGRLAGFSYKYRRALAGGFVLLFFATWYLSSQGGISYNLNQRDPIAEIFPEENPVVLLYSGQDEEAAAEIGAGLETQEKVSAVFSWSTTFGAKRSAEEMAEWMRGMMEGGGSSYAALAGSLMEGMDLSSFQDRLNEESLRTLYQMYGMLSGEEASEKLSLEQLISFLGKFASNPLMGALAGRELSEQMAQAEGMIETIRAQLMGPEHSLMMISTTLPVESEETEAFLTGLQEQLDQKMTGGCYMIGNSVMNHEMKQSFGGEMLTITLLTAAAIFLVVLISFRNWAVPVILVSLVQCGVFLTETVTWLLGFNMYYLALLIVQCILMGATVDYGILFANCYRERRKGKEIRQAVESAYSQSMHTILTSSLFMIFGTGAIGFSPADPTIAQICQSISLGAAAAVLLVIFVLPGMLAALDRFVNRTKELKK